MPEHRESVAGPVEQEAALLALASTASRMEALAKPDAFWWELILHELATLPLQLHYVDSDSAFSHWLAIASLAEQRERLDIARTIVDGVRHAIESKAAIGDETVTAREQRAICWSRRGRIARSSGAHDDAFECYAEARRLVRDLPWLDARPVSELGLGVLSAVKGNYPTAERHASTVLKHRPLTPAAHRFGAHHLMTLAKRKRGELVDALLHGWQAIDMVPAGDVRALEVMLSLAEIAIELSDFEAAETGFASIVSQPGPARIRVSALVGAVASCVHANRVEREGAMNVRLTEYQSSLSELLGAQLSPRDRCRALFALAEIHRHSGAVEAAERVTTDASAIAHQYGYFEQQFRLDEFVNQLRAASLSQAKRSTTSPSPILPVQKRHPALARLANLSAR